MQALGDRGGAAVECRQRLGGQILFGAAQGFGRYRVAKRRHQEPVRLQFSGELQQRTRVLAAEDNGLAAAPARGRILRPFLADAVIAGLDLDPLHLMRPVERCRHAPVDRRLDRLRIGAGFLDAKLELAVGRGRHRVRRSGQDAIRLPGACSARLRQRGARPAQGGSNQQRCSATGHLGASDRGRPRRQRFKTPQPTGRDSRELLGQ